MKNEENENKVTSQRKRPMKRKRSREVAEFEARSKQIPKNSSYSKTLVRLKEKIKYKENRIAQLLERIENLKIDYSKLENRLGAIHRRELRKQETRLKNLRKRYEAFKERKGQRHRSIVYRKHYKTYESDGAVKKFENHLTKLSEASLNQTHFETFEKLIKLYKFLSTNEYNISLNHYLVLLGLFLIKPTHIAGITVPKLIIPTLSQHVVRKCLKDLLVNDLCLRSGIRYRITALGEHLLEDSRRTGRVTSELLEIIKKQTGLVKETKEEDNYDEF